MGFWDLFHEENDTEEQVAVTPEGDAAGRFIAEGISACESERDVAEVAQSAADLVQRLAARNRARRHDRR